MVISPEELLLTMTNPSIAQVQRTDGVWVVLQSHPCLDFEFSNGFEERAWHEAVAERFPTYVIRAHTWS